MNGMNRTNPFEVIRHRARQGSGMSDDSPVDGSLVGASITTSPPDLDRRKSEASQ